MYVFLSRLFLPVAMPALAANGDDLEYQVKAAMIYNFTRFVDWPPAVWKGSHDPMIVGILGSDPLGPTLDDVLQGKSHEGRDIRVRRVHSIEGIEGCHLLFISKSERKHLAEILHAAQSFSVLTVSDIEGFVEAGGMIGFILDSNRIRFEIGAAAANRARLVISSKLLGLAAAGGRNG